MQCSEYNSEIGILTVVSYRSCRLISAELARLRLSWVTVLMYCFCRNQVLLSSTDDVHQTSKMTGRATFHAVQTNCTVALRLSAVQKPNTELAEANLKLMPRGDFLG